VNGQAGYVWVNTVPAGSTSGSDPSFSAGFNHTYTVDAFDGAVNTSDPSTGASAGAAPTPPSSVSYAYDPADRLTCITLPSGSITPSRSTPWCRGELGDRLLE
jgi:hypothetical protein